MIDWWELTPKNVLHTIIIMVPQYQILPKSMDLDRRWKIRNNGRTGNHDLSIMRSFYGLWTNVPLTTKFLVPTVETTHNTLPWMLSISSHSEIPSNHWWKLIQAYNRSTYCLICTAPRSWKLNSIADSGGIYTWTRLRYTGHNFMHTFSY
jgi:hypothetical protein